MLQDGGLYPGIRPLEALQLFASYYDDPDDPDRLLDLVGLRESEHTLVRRMSGGQQQRLSLALALVGRPTLVFLDEPTAGMDPHARATTWALIRELRDRGATVVLTTHAMHEAEQLCDRVGIVHHGRLVAYGVAVGAHDRRGRRHAVLGRERARRREARARARAAADAGARGAARRLRRRRARDARRSSPRSRPGSNTSTCCSASCAPGKARSRTCSCVSPGDVERVKARAITAQTRVEMLLTVRRAESLLVTLAIPLGILVFFTKVDAVNTTLPDPVDFLVPGVLALAVMSSAMVSLGIATGIRAALRRAQAARVDAVLTRQAC